MEQNKMEKVGEIIYDRDSFISILNNIKDLLNLALYKDLDPEVKEVTFEAFKANAAYLESAYDYLVSRLQHSETERFKL